MAVERRLPDMMPARQQDPSNLPVGAPSRPTCSDRVTPWGRGRVLSIALALAPMLVLPTMALTLASCKGGPVIPGTEIPDTEDNRQIIGVLERYRTSFVSRDAAAVLATAHPTYLDKAGTDDPSDDTTYNELGPLLRRRLSQLDSIRFTIDYLEIQQTDDRAVVRVWIDAAYRFKPLLDSFGDSRLQAPYARVMDHSEFELVREGQNWLIVRGL